MQISAELSIYPLTSSYEAVVWKFIEVIKKHDTLEVITNAMSTQVFGEMNRVMSAVEEALTEVYNADKAVLVMKIGQGTLKL